MASTPKPSRFKRSTERKVSDPHEEYVAQRGRKEYEEIGFSPESHSVLVEPLDLSDSWERRVDFMEAEDASRYDLEGRVF